MESISSRVKLNLESERDLKEFVEYIDKEYSEIVGDLVYTILYGESVLQDEIMRQLIRKFEKS